MPLYIEFPTSNITSIDVNFEDYGTGDKIPPHMHHYYEFTLVTRGTCIHRFRDVDVPIIAGDVFLIPPDETHSYYMHAPASIVNCYFYPERLGQYATYISDAAFEHSFIPSTLDDIKKHWDSLLPAAAGTAIRQEAHTGPVTDNLTRQGVLHLPPEEALDVENLLHRMESEHMNLAYDAEYMKAAILQMILVILKRARNNSPQRPPVQPDRRKQLLLGSLAYLEEHYAQTITVKEIAAASSLSESYFRSIFKEVTGLSPLDYLNRLRISKSIDLLQRGDLSVTETASMVGIPDANYFTRLFRKIMGQTPNSFKNHPGRLALPDEK